MPRRGRSILAALLAPLSLSLLACAASSAPAASERPPVARSEPASLARTGPSAPALPRPSRPLDHASRAPVTSAPPRAARPAPAAVSPAVAAHAHARAPRPRREPAERSSAAAGVGSARSGGAAAPGDPPGPTRPAAAPTPVAPGSNAPVSSASAVASLAAPALPAPAAPPAPSAPSRPSPRAALAPWPALPLAAAALLLGVVWRVGRRRARASDPGPAFPCAAPERLVRLEGALSGLNQLDFACTFTAGGRPIASSAEVDLFLRTSEGAAVAHLALDVHQGHFQPDALGAARLQLTLPVEPLRPVQGAWVVLDVVVVAPGAPRVEASTRFMHRGLLEPVA